MKVRYSLTRWDIFKGQSLAMKFHRGLPYFLAVLGAFILYTSFTYREIHDRSLAYKLAYSVFYLFFSLGIGLMGGIAVTALNVFLGNGKGHVGEHELVITEEGLEESTAFNRSVNKWAGMRGLKETAGYYFLFVSDSNAHIVPKKKPMLEGDLASFIEEFKRRIEAA